MTRKDNILEELKSLNSSLANQVMPWSVPANYFDGLAESVLARIRAIESGEVEYSLSLIDGLQHDMPYTVPAGYFETLAERALNAAKSSSVSAEEELASISPFLSGLKKEMPFEVPAGYFDSLPLQPVQVEKPAAKVIPFTRRKSFRYAAAAVVAGLIISVGLLIGIGNKNADQSIAKFEQKIEKEIEKTSDKELDEFLQQFSDAGLTGEEKAYTAPVTLEAEELLKDVPDDELKEFLEETSTTETTLNNETLFLN